MRVNFATMAPIQNQTLFKPKCCSFIKCYIVSSLVPVVHGENETTLNFANVKISFFSQFWAVLHIIFNHLQQNYLYGTEKQRFTINQIFDHNFRIFSVPQIIISLSSYLFEQSTRAHCYLKENKNFHFAPFSIWREVYNNPSFNLDTLNNLILLRAQFRVQEPAMWR